MNAESDPMQGTPEEREAYQEKIMETMRAAVEESRAARRQPQTADGREPVMIGSQHFPGAMTSA